MFIVIVGLIFCSCTTPVSKYLIKPVMEEPFKEELINGIKNDTTLYRKKQIEEIRAGKLLFPYSEFDDLRMYSFNRETRKKEFIRTLVSISAQKLLFFFNNPNNFGIAECGTSVPEIAFEFYFDKEVVGAIIISCNHKYAEWNPGHKIIYFGEMMNDSLVNTLMR